MRGHDFFEWLRIMALQEGAVIIAPHRKPFARYQRQFLDGLRRCPASINHPPGVNPYTTVLKREGQWMMIWIPDDKG